MALFKRYYIHILLEILGFLMCTALLTFIIVAIDGNSADDNIIPFQAVIISLATIAIFPAILSAAIVFFAARQCIYDVKLKQDKDIGNIYESILRYSVYVANNTHMEDNTIDGVRMISFSKKNIYFRWLTLPIIVCIKQNQLSISASKSHMKYLVKNINGLDN